MNAYRVIPFDPSAAPTERGGALFVPPGGQNRIDNPELYSVLYVAGNPEAAIAESFGRIPVWRPDTFVHSSGRAFALVTYAIPESVSLFDLDDVDALKSIGITRPSSVVTRDRAKTQRWARTIFEFGGYGGASWWSFYGPDWKAIGLWERDGITVVGAPETITSAAQVVRDTAVSIVRQIAR